MGFDQAVQRRYTCLFLQALQADVGYELDVPDDQSYFDMEIYL
jgi:hypothetical protein